MNWCAPNSMVPNDSVLNNLITETIPSLYHYFITNFFQSQTLFFKLESFISYSLLITDPENLVIHCAPCYPLSHLKIAIRSPHNSGLSRECKYNGFSLAL